MFQFVTFFVVVVLSDGLAQLNASGSIGGELPKGLDGRVLNLDFETGDLRDWKAEGKAFSGQPIEGDVVAKRRGDSSSQHQGRFWLGGFEKLQDPPTGTLTSEPFKIDKPWASFLIGGGPNPETRVEIVDNGTGAVLFRTSGIEEENLKRVVVDLAKHQNKVVRVRVVDDHSGHWGHINFDDFRLHTRRPQGEDRKPRQLAGPADNYKFAGLPPEEAAKAMTVPEGFSVGLFAGEPDVNQPVAMALDDRGRVWIAEAYSYPQKRPKGKGIDRILILEDADGDGKFDKRTVFMEGLNLVSGLEVGHGGVWIGAAPELLFVPLDPSGDKPAGEPKVVLDGWGLQDTHETLNTFIWGPDGWLWGCHGIFTHSRVGKPGTSDAQRVAINAGLWRYHPTRQVFEVVSHGTSNPWGLDFDQHGEAIIEACVIPHAFHMIPGARYLRQAGSHFNPNTYADIGTIADHLHYVGANPHGGNNRSDSAGGGHAHCGTMIYQGGTWPAEYHNQFFLGNIHGRRLNVEQLVPKGSGYVASHRPDFLMANDAWARFINFRYGPDGNVYLIDWYDKQACHTGDVKAFDRTNGRVYKISYKDTPKVKVDLAKATDDELAGYQTHNNDWFVRHARRLLAERKPGAAVRAKLADQATEHQNPLKRLRGLWALHSTGGLEPAVLAKLLADKDDHVRGWAIRLSTESGTPDVLLPKLVEMAKADPSPVVRRELASLAIREEPPVRLALVEPLAAHTEDASDFNLPLMIWYALEPLVVLDPTKALKIAASSYDPLPGFVARRLAGEATESALNALANFLPTSGTKLPAMIEGMSIGLRGRKGLMAPAGWDKALDAALAQNDEITRDRALSLATQFGDKRALDKLTVIAADASAKPQTRLQALEALRAAAHPPLAEVALKVVANPDSPTELRLASIRALASTSDNQVPGKLLASWDKLDASAKREVVATLAARPAWAVELLGAVEKNQLKTTDVPAETVRQLHTVGDTKLRDRITKAWGAIRATPADRLQKINQVRKLASAPGPVDLAHGRHLYQKVCAQCHTLYGAGGKVGPDLTGSNRPSLDYLLENILDPSAVIPKEYAATVIELKNGRFLTGMIRDENPNTLTVVGANETLTLAKADIEDRKASDLSMMPDNLVANLDNRQLRDLLGYLRHPSQTPILATVETAKAFFNGKDLAGWNGDQKLWSVVQGESGGEIVAKSTGLKNNSFLKSDMELRDFRLKLQVKLTPNEENSGIQFRSEPLPDGEMRGPQADAGKGWWGKLYEESGRGLLWKESGERHVKPGEWNDYVIEAVGPRVRTWINGQLCVDLTDEKISRKGQVGLQVHSGGPLEVRFRKVELEVLENPAK
ncbi:MAG: DUF1080 domain-containing protein [Planctomycetota bacterium]|nr:MAG: DUF1080 domain-containing protein [Planctomycetota bacterium]